MEKEVSCRLEVEDRRGRALDGVEGRLFDKMKERMGIVAEQGRVELQYSRVRTRRLIFWAVR
jgi:hypothetical protein